MNNTVRIYKGEKKSASVCCGSEVPTVLIDSCCGTQELPDDIKIAFLQSYLQELDLAENIDFDVCDLEDGASQRSLREFCMAAKIITGDQDDLNSLLPLVVVDEKVKFIGRIPTGDELVEELENIH